MLCSSAGWLCRAAQTPYNASSCPCTHARLGSARTSSAQAFQNNNSASQFQGENRKVCFRKTASILGKCGSLCRNHDRHGAGYRRTIACCCEKPSPPAALGPKTNPDLQVAEDRQPYSKALVLCVGSPPNTRENGLTWKDLQKCFL